MRQSKIEINDDAMRLKMLKLAVESLPSEHVTPYNIVKRAEIFAMYVTKGILYTEYDQQEIGTLVEYKEKKD